eukprot:GSMAST32.ASY1.ANO1.834.1 assembled CDS
MSEIANKIRDYFEDDLLCIRSDDNAENLIEENMLSQMELRGIEGITKVYMRQAKRQVWTGDSFESKDEWVLDTDGTNLLEVLSHPDVNATRTISNDVVEAIQVFGIEGARAALLNEVRRVISFDGSYVNYRHLAMLADVMTCRGHFMPITRHGINRVDSGPLMRCSFEETVEILMDAAVLAERDPLKGVTENVMLGQLCPMGSGDMELLLDEDALLSAMPYEPRNVVSVDTGFDVVTPDVNNAATPMHGALGGMDLQFSPGMSSPGATPRFDDVGVGFGVGGDGASPMSSAYSPTSPAYSPTSPAYSPTSPAYRPTDTSTKKNGFSPQMN